MYGRELLVRLFVYVWERITCGQRATCSVHTCWSELSMGYLWESVYVRVERATCGLCVGKC